MKKKRFASDVFLNFLSVIVPLIVLQLITYPEVGKLLPDEYGLMITIYSLMTLISGTMGNVINNIRLIENNAYTDKKYSGDFNLIILFAIIISTIITVIGIIYYEKTFDLFSVITISISAIFTLLNGYYRVEYLIKINYRKLLVNTVAMAAGYLVGSLLFIATKQWEYIYLCGQSFAFIHLYFTTSLIKEPLIKTKLFRITINETMFLLVSNILLQGVNYADKMILLPLLGGTAVSIYYAATIISKMVSLGINPINGVMLTYLSKKKAIATNTFRTIIIVGIIASIIGYFICVIISKPVLLILYPQWAQDAIKLVPITTVSVCVYAFCNLISPLTLKFCKMKWQIFINGFTFATYIICSLILLKLYGIYGFCVGVVLSNIVRLICNFIVYKYGKKEN